MNRTLIRMPQRLLLAAALVSLGTVALAQSTAPAPTASAPAAAAQWQKRTPAMLEQWHERMAQRHARYMADLKTALALTPGQESAWNQFEATMQPPAPPQRSEPGQWAKLTTPERIDRMEQRMADHQQHFKQMGDAVKTFYGQLTPEQQKTFDQRAMHAWAMRGEYGQFGMSGKPGAGAAPLIPHVRHHRWSRPVNRPAAAASQAD